LVKQVDKKIGENESLKAFVVVLSEDADATAEELKKLAEKQGIKNVPLTVFEGAAGPPSYKIAEDAEVTVLMWSNTEVKVNHAFAAGEFNKKAVKSVVADVEKILN
jgi:ABC-type uncharacterized transport system substrate-binding protein